MNAKTGATTRLGNQLVLCRYNQHFKDKNYIMTKACKDVDNNINIRLMLNMIAGTQEF